MDEQVEVFLLRIWIYFSFVLMLSLRAESLDWYLGGPTKDRKGLKPPKWIEKNIRAPKRIFTCHFMPYKCMLIIFNVEIFISQRNFKYIM